MEGTSPKRNPQGQRPCNGMTRRKSPEGEDVSSNGPLAWGSEDLGLILTVSHGEPIPTRQGQPEDAEPLTSSDPSMSLTPLRQEDQRKDSTGLAVPQTFEHRMTL